MRMPIGVPVVRPSNTPESMRTWSASRRWLTKCEVPLRRRSTSCCRSASVSSSPGGQPSTMQPIAGSWLSPKVVTENNLPIVLPDILSALSAPAAVQLLTCQHEHSTATACELQPHERQARPTAAYRALGVAHLDDEQPARAQVSRRSAQDDAHRVESLRPAGERDARLVAVFCGQTRELHIAHIRRIRNDDIVGRTAERAEVIGLHEPHAGCQAMAPEVGAGHLERLAGDIDRIDARGRKVLRTGDRDAAGAGADVEHSPYLRRIDPGREAALDDLRER